MPQVTTIETVLCNIAAKIAIVKRGTFFKPVTV
jgi:hypothetical protein